MPTYEYICTKCGERFDVFQSIKDAPLAVCPKEKCARKRWGKGKVKKLISAGAGLLFKGSGFYITDYRSENYKQAAKRDVPATKSGGESSPAKKGDSKSAAATSTGSTSKPAGTAASSSSKNK